MKEMMWYEQGPCEQKGKIWTEMRNILVINEVGIDIDSLKVLEIYGCGT